MSSNVVGKSVLPDIYRVNLSAKIWAYAPVPLSSDIPVVDPYLTLILDVEPLLLKRFNRFTCG